MSDNYIEHLIKKKANAGMLALRTTAIVLAVIMGLLGLMGSMVSLLIAVVFGIMAYLLNLQTVIEYEYLFLNKELSVDKIQAQSKRKRIKEFDLNKVELIAPAKSHRLDSYKNNQKCVAYDFSSGSSETKVYSFIYAGDRELARVTIDMTDEILKYFKDISPRKVFED